MSTVNCEESYSALVRKLYFELRVQVMLHILFLTAEVEYYLPQRSGEGSRTFCEI